MLSSHDPKSIAASAAPTKSAAIDWTPHFDTSMKEPRATVLIPGARVRYLADRITCDQVKEITQMQLLIDDIERNGRQSDVPRSAAPAVLTPEAAQEAQDLLDGKLMREEPL